MPHSSLRSTCKHGLGKLFMTRNRLIRCGLRCGARRSSHSDLEDVVGHVVVQRAVENGRGALSSQAPSGGLVHILKFHRLHRHVGVVLAAAFQLSKPPIAMCAESLPNEWASIFDTMMDNVQALGPLGPVALVAAIATFECIPFFPTQPLALSSGLLFGATCGAAVNLAGTCGAATIAFVLARTAGRGLAARVIAEEAGGQGPVAARLTRLQDTIRRGSPMQQFTAILLIRLTPVVPFSASNYVLGVSQVGPGPFLCATILGMTVWSAVFASIGSAGAALLHSGGDLQGVFRILSEQAGDATEKALVIALVMGLVVLAVSRLPPSIALSLPSPDDLSTSEAQNVGTQDEVKQSVKR